MNSAHVVEFYPSVDDYVYIATRIGGSAPASTLTGYAYYLFLILNVIAFPAFLWMSDYFAVGIAVLSVNLIALLFIVPRVNSDGYRKHYHHIFGNREKEIAKVVLSSDGVTYESDGALSFWPWRRIESVEENDESIYFFLQGHGFAVRKNGFPYKDEENAFIDYSRRNVEHARTSQLGA